MTRNRLMSTATATVGQRLVPEGLGVACEQRDLAPDKWVDLDPSDWPTFRNQAHQMLTDMLDYLEGIRNYPVWRDAPDDVRRLFHSSLPRRGRSLRPFMKNLCGTFCLLRRLTSTPDSWAGCKGAVRR